VIALGITYANLTDVISPAIDNLSALETLNLDYNNLLGRIPMEFGKLSRLKWLGLSGNHLEGVIPETLGLQIGHFLRYTIRPNGRTVVLSVFLYG
jgi:Leucine-rich repeat (LRR) protein